MIRTPKRECLISQSCGSPMPTILAMQGMDMIIAGTEGYLYFISSEEDKTRPGLEETPVACDFHNVFLEELAGLPTRREVDFLIDLIPEVTPISKTIYRLAPA